jgi:hypothetical protein
MKFSGKAVSLLVISVFLLSGMAAIGSLASPSDGSDESRATHTEVDDATTKFDDAFELQADDVYYGHLNRADDKADYFKIDVLNLTVVNVHVYIIGHDGGTTWVRPPNTPPPWTPGTETAIFATYLLAKPRNDMGIDGAFNYPVRDLCLNMCAPVPGTNTYYINVSLDWSLTPNNFTWDYRLEVSLSPVPTISSGQVVTGTIDLASRDTHWYKIYANYEEEINGSFTIRNFNFGDETERNLDMWVFPDDIGGWPFGTMWDWSAAPNEPTEPVSVLATYRGWFYIKLRGMNHTNNFDVSYSMRLQTSPIPKWTGNITNAYFDRYWHDTDWFKFELNANQPKTGEPGFWNEACYFNMTERADSEHLPDFDLYLFGRSPGSRWLDLLDSSFRNDHPDFFSAERDPNKNTEHVRGAAFYNGTYYVEVNAWNNTGFYDLVRDDIRVDNPVSDMDNLPENAREARAGIFNSHIHQAFDHYDWYKVEAQEKIRVQFDAYKSADLFNVSIFKKDELTNSYVLLGGGWNTWYNFSTNEDHLTNLVNVQVDLTKLGLGAGTYYIACFAAVGAEMATDEITSRAFVYKIERDAEANYELRLWIDGVPPYNRPPQVKQPIPDLIVEEDTDLPNKLNLYEYFEDTDVGDAVLKFRASIISGQLERLVLSTDVLGFLAKEHFNGKVRVKVNAIDRKFLQTSLTWNITFTKVNDPPYLVFDPSEGPYMYTMPEDSLRQFDFKLLTYDVDNNDEINITFPEPDNLEIVIDPSTLVAEVSGAADWFGEETVYFLAKDLQGAETSIPVKFIVENVEDNPSIIKQIGEREIEEEGSLTLSMAEFFMDPDGDDLNFVLSSNLNVAFTFDPVTYVMTMTPDHDWFGFREIWITAVDTTGRTAQQRFQFIVLAVNDPPEIKAVSPPEDTLELREDKDQSFVVLNVSDPEFSILIYSWYLDGDLVGPSNFYNYKPTYRDQGNHELKVVVTDEEGATDDFIWTVIILDVPLPPEGGIASPANKAKFSSSEKVPFVALFYDVDDPTGTSITYQWYIDDKAESTESTFDKKLGEGDHRVKLVVNSGDQSVEKYLNITVEKADSPGFSAPLVMAGLVGGMMAAAAWRRRRL